MMLVVRVLPSVSSGLLNVCELMVRKLPIHQVFKNLMFSAHPHGALFHTRMPGIRCTSPKTIPNKQTVSILDEEAQLVGPTGDQR